MTYNFLSNIKNHWIKKDGIKSLVSVIVPTNNRCRLLVHTLNSVANQSYRPIEIVIVDDGSTDNTRNFVKSWIRGSFTNKSFKIKYVYQSNNGASAARNRGIIESNGEFIQFLDSDDLLAPGKIASQVEIFPFLDRMTAVFGDYRRFSVNKDGKILIYKKSVSINPHRSLMDWLEGNFIALHSILWRRQDIFRNGPWNEKLSLNDDGDYATRFLLNSGKFLFCKNAWAYYRYYTDNTPRLVSEITESAINSSLHVLNNIENTLRKRGEIEEYQDVLAANYFELAEDSSISSKQIMRFCLNKFNQLSITGEIPGSLIHRLVRRTLGINFKKRLAYFLRYRLGFQPFRPITVVDNIAKLYSYDSPEMSYLKQQQ